MKHFICKDKREFEKILSIKPSTILLVEENSYFNDEDEWKEIQVFFKSDLVYSVVFKDEKAFDSFVEETKHTHTFVRGTLH